MARSVVPIAQTALGRPQEMGKLKLGKKVPTRNGKERPTSIETFRFVSRDGEAIAHLASMFGGTPRVVDGQHDLESEAKEIEVILPPDPLGGTPIYELWSGGGCQRRCDGETATVPVRNGEDVDFLPQRCVCAANERFECKPTVRLSVILPYVSLGGVWNLKTNSWAATREMQQMVALIEMAQSRGLVAAALALEPRKQVSGGQTKNFVVPVLKLKATLHELAAGTSNALGSGAPAMAALPAPATALELGRAQLNAAWAAADEASRREAESWMATYGVTKETMTVEAVESLLDILVVHEPDEEM